jgi:hypothetical protein
MTHDLSHSFAAVFIDCIYLGRLTIFSFFSFFLLAAYTLNQAHILYIDKLCSKSTTNRIRGVNFLAILSAGYLGRDRFSENKISLDQIP